jgi:hypothetical protein
LTVGTNVNVPAGNLLRRCSAADFEPLGDGGRWLLLGGDMAGE